MADNSRKDQQNFARRLALPGLARKTLNKGKAAASFSQTASVPAEDLLPAVSQPQRNIKRFCIGLPDAPFFVPRDKLYASNLQHLANDLVRLRLQILYGRMGCGKTALARQYASQNFQGQQGESPDKRYTSVFWLDATKGSLEETLGLTFKTQMKFQSGQNQIKEFTKKLQTYEVGLAKNEYWLLVIDGCDEPRYAQEYLDLPDHLRKYTGRGHIILTTRRVPDKTQYIYMLRKIENMTQEAKEAENLLLSAYFDEYVDIIEMRKMQKSTLLQDNAEMQAATRLVADLWYSPLLIYELGKYMYRIQRRPGYIADLLPEEVIQNPREVAQNEDRFSQTFTQFITNWKQDYQFIQNMPTSYDILMLCAFLNKERIPGQLIDSRPEKDSSNPVYPHRLVRPNDHIKPLRDVGFLTHNDENETFLNLNICIRDMVHRKFQPQASDTTAQRKALESDLRQHQVYAIHTVSTVFLGFDDSSSKYDDYKPHIMKCVQYLEESAIQEYIRDQKPYMLDTVFQFLATVGEYLHQHPHSEGSYSISEIAEADEKRLEMNRGHLFELAFQIYRLWPSSERTKPERMQILHTMLPILHEYFLYEQKRPALKEIEGYYPILQKLDAGKVESISIHYDLGSLKSDLNDFEGAERQLAQLYSDLDKASHDTTNERQKLHINLWKAEIQVSRATNWARQAFHSQEKNQALNTNGKRPDSDLRSAIKDYKEAGNWLEGLKDNPNYSEKTQQRIKDLKERYTISNVILSLVKAPLSGTTPVSAGIDGIPPIKEVEKYQDLLEDKFSAIAPPKREPYLTYLQLVVDLNNLAEVYRRLGEEEEEQKGVPPHKIPYFEYSKDYSLCALTCYDYFYQIYPEKHLQVQVILQTVWANYKENPLYGANENKTPTRMLRDLQERYRKA